MSVDAVAAEAGVSKPTLYLRYPSKAALATAALAHLPEQTAPAKTGERAPTRSPFLGEDECDEKQFIEAPQPTSARPKLRIIRNILSGPAAFSLMLYISTTDSLSSVGDSRGTSPSDPERAR
jgi:AcrR family transcriptional regulator